MGRVFTNGLWDPGSIPGCVIPKTLKMVLDTSLLNGNIRHISRVEWSNPGKGVAPSPTPQCSSYWKGNLLVAFNYICQLTSLVLSSTKQDQFPFAQILCHLTFSEKGKFPELFQTKTFSLPKICSIFKNHQTASFSKMFKNSNFSQCPHTMTRKLTNTVVTRKPNFYRNNKFVFSL